MAENRVTSLIADVLTDMNPDGRVTALIADVLSDAEPQGRVTSLWAEALIDNVAATTAVRRRFASVIG